MILLTPGPCQTDPLVRAAAASEDMNHRDPAFVPLFREVQDRLLAVQPDLEPAGFRPYLIGGSGTAAVEAMITSCVASGPVLLVDNGVYSDRVREMLEIHRIPHVVLEIPWDQPWDEVALHRIEQRMAARSFEVCLATHHETTLGLLNPIGRLAEIAGRHGVRLLVDAMSSFGADELPLAGVAAFATSGNKCLHALPGVGIVMVSAELSERLASHPRRSYYLHLPLYGGESPPLTAPVPAIRALLEALRQNPGGQVERGRVYGEKRRVLAEGLGQLGFGFAVPHESSSVSLLCPTIPAGWTYDRWFAANAELGFMIYGCKGSFRERFFQVSVMGETTLEDLLAWLAAVERLVA